MLARSKPPYSRPSIPFDPVRVVKSSKHIISRQNSMLAIIGFTGWLIESECAIMTVVGKPFTALNHFG